MRFFRFWTRNKKTTPKGRLLYAFTWKGYDYYQFPERFAVPVNRLLNISEYARWISRGLDKDNLLELMNIADELLFNGIQNNKNAAKLGYLITEIKEREWKAVPIEVYYNYFAAIYIREDEDIHEFNQQIQKEKVLAFREASNEENSFFFQLPEFKKLMNSSSITTEQWRDFLSASAMESQRIKKLRESLGQIK